MDKIKYIVIGLIVFIFAPTAVSARPKKSRPINFEAIIENAKRLVYPCLVSVKPIQEEFSRGEKKRRQVLGSGVIISPKGLVVTNHHVAEKAIDIKCVLFNKEQISAKILGLDAETDLALLQLQIPKKHPPLPFATFADSDKAKVGQFVLALGSPFGFTRSVSLGIVSNTKRYIGFETIYKYNIWIQTDAAINPGNSGGPLVNTEGKIVGINTLAIGGSGLGFAIPSNTVREIVKRLKKDGRIIRAWTGMKLQALKDFHSDTFIDSENGVLVCDIEKDSPAHEVGIMANDILIKVNGKKINGKYVENLPEIRWLLADLSLKKPSKFIFKRKISHKEEKIITVEFTPTEKGKFEGKDFECKRWDMTVKEISQFRDPDLYFHKKKGVYIRGIRYPGNARDAGLNRKDIILNIDGKEIDSLKDIKKIYKKIMADKKREKKLRFKILRRGYTQWIIMDYRTDYKEE
jgi:serine protease Do